MAERKIWRMSELAAGQDYKWIRKQYNAAIKAANDRIKTLNKPKYQDKAQAYEYYVKGDLSGAPYTKQRGGATVFTALPKGSDKKEALEALRMVERFLGAKTSTVAGIKEVERERETALQEVLNSDFEMRGQAGGRPPKLTRQEADNILRWMGSAEGREAKRNFDSHQVREAIMKSMIASRSGRGKGSRKTVGELYKEFDESQQSLADWIAASEATIGGYI